MSRVWRRENGNRIPGAMDGTGKAGRGRERAQSTDRDVAGGWCRACRVERKKQERRPQREGGQGVNAMHRTGHPLKQEQAVYPQGVHRMRR